MDDITIKSELNDELEESLLNYNSNESLGTTIKDESLDRNYEEYGEYEIEIQSGTIHPENTDIDVEAQVYSSNLADDDVDVNRNSGGKKNPSKTSQAIDGTDIKFEFTAGYRRNSVLMYLIDQKQLFAKKYTHKNLDRYACYTKSCKASLLFNSSTNRVIKLFHKFHLHPDQSDVYKKMKVLNEMKDYCMTNVGCNLTAKQIFDRKCDVMKDGAHLVEYNSIKKSLNRLKKTAVLKSLKDNYEMINDYADATNNDTSATKWDTKLSSERVPSPVSSDACSQDSSNAAPSAKSFSGHTITTPTPAKSKSSTSPKQQPFKKIKLTHEVPITQGYLEEAPFEIQTLNMKKSPPPRPNPRIHQDEGTHICSSCPCIAAQESEYDKIGKTWASELKLMSMEQQIFAKRAIAEILFEGQLGGLSRNSILICQESRKTDGDPSNTGNNDCI